MCALPHRSVGTRARCVTALSSRQTRRTCVHAVFPTSPISTSPGTGTYPSRLGALKRYNGCPPRSPFTWECWSPILCYLLMYLCVFPVGHQVRPEAVEDTTIPRHSVRSEHLLVPGPGRQAPETSHFDPSSKLLGWYGIDAVGVRSLPTGGFPREWLPRHMNEKELFSLLELPECCRAHPGQL